MIDHKTRLSRAASKFFEYSRERYQILLNRRADLPKEQWTNDPVLQRWSFCNIFREDDRTTIWFRENIRGPLQDSKRVILATIAFRWFNRINAGEVLKPFLLQNEWSQGKWRAALQARREVDGVIVTGAYMIKSPPKLSKIDGLLWSIWQAKEREDDLISKIYGKSLEEGWEAIRQLPYMGDFTSYEVITDLRYTSMVEPSDALTWANPGPGCASGLGELFYQDRNKYDRHNAGHRVVMIQLMRQLLTYAHNKDYWPAEWPKWELREVEHTLCEWFKYRRGQMGLRLKRRYRG